MSDLSLKRQLIVVVDFWDDVCFRRSFPEPFILRSTCCDHKSTWNILLPANVLIFQHQTYVYLSVFMDLDSELRIIKPSVVTFWLHVLVFKPFLCLSSFLLRNWTFSTVSLWSPLTFYGVDFPVFRKNFVNRNLIELSHKISKRHPPGTIWLFSSRSILHILLDCLVLFPVIGLLTKRTSPYPFVSPRISQSH